MVLLCYLWSDSVLATRGQRSHALTRFGRNPKAHGTCRTYPTLSRRQTWRRPGTCRHQPAEAFGAQPSFIPTCLAGPKWQPVGARQVPFRHMWRTGSQVLPEGPGPTSSDSTRSGQLWSHSHDRRPSRKRTARMDFHWAYHPHSDGETQVEGKRADPAIGDLTPPGGGVGMPAPNGGDRSLPADDDRPGWRVTTRSKMPCPPRKRTARDGRRRPCT